MCDVLGYFFGVMLWQIINGGRNQSSNSHNLKKNKQLLNVLNIFLTTTLHKSRY